MPVCSLPENALDYSDKITSIYDNGLRNMARTVADGSIDLGQWVTDMKAAIEQMLVFQAAAAVGGDKSFISDDDRQAIQDTVAEQYKYLDGFAQAIEEAIDQEGSLGFVESRAAMYAQSTQAMFWQQAIDVTLPAYPKDGSTKCLSHCNCKWDVDCDEDGNVLATWIMSEGENCPDCEARASEWAPLVIKREAA